MPRRRRVWKLTRPIVGAGLLAFLLHLVDFSRVLSVVREADWPLLALALPFLLLNPLLSAARLKLLTDVQGMSLNLRQVVVVNLVSRFYGLVLPGRVGGGAVRWYRLVKLEDRKLAVLGAILASRVLHLLGLCGLGLVFLAWDRPDVAGVAAVGAPVLLLGGALVGVLLFFLGSELPRLLRWFPRVGRLRGLGETLKRFRRLSAREASLVAGLSLAENLSATVIIYLSALALGIALPFTTLGWVRAVVQLVALAPVSLSGLGVREGGLLIALEPYGVTGSAAVALGLVVFAGTLLVGLIGGLVELALQLSSRARTGLESSPSLASRR